MPEGFLRSNLVGVKCRCSVILMIIEISLTELYIHSRNGKFNSLFSEYQKICSTDFWDVLRNRKGYEHEYELGEELCFSCHFLPIDVVQLRES